jgi:hypothetical protein
MLRLQVTIEQFAHWGFEDDLKCGCFNEDNKDDWPMEILLRLEDHGLSEQTIKEYKESGWR